MKETARALSLDDAIAGRRSVRWYRPETVAPDLVDSLLRSAALAPSAHNRQPWRFAVLAQRGARSQLAESMAAVLRRDRARDGDPPEVIEADAQRSIRRLVEAPVVILAAATMIDMDRYPDENRMQAERVLAIQATAMAVQNLLLAAHGAGLGACIVCAPSFCQDVVVEALQLPRDWLPQCAVTLGWPLAPQAARPRRALGEFVKYRTDAPGLEAGGRS